MITARKRKHETQIYTGAWILVVTLYLLDMMRVRYADGQPMLNSEVVFHMLFSLLPFFILFSIHNSLLIPRLLFRNRYRSYLLFASLLVLVIWGSQAIQFFHEMSLREPPQHPGMHGPRPLVPWPLFLALVYDLLIVGVNLAVALVFQRFEDRIERERLLKANAENSLAYLKAQINPHFYMNMLNNIHGMIELDPAKAQDMVIDMSKLMHYMIYDGARERIALSAEIAFLRNYIGLMRQRYPSDKVSITMSLPESDRANGIMIPPLLFIVFIENSFKHGISYREPSYVDMSLTVDDAKVCFRCSNSVHPRTSVVRAEGIGLKNVGQRLKLIYGDKASLKITSDCRNYTVDLKIPAYENPNPHH